MPERDADLLTRLTNLPDMVRDDVLEFLGAGQMDDTSGQATMDRLMASIQRNRSSGMAATG